MFDSLFYALIGNWGRAVIGWALENPFWVFLGFALWLAVFGMGKLQLEGIRKKNRGLGVADLKANRCRYS